MAGNAPTVGKRIFDAISAWCQEACLKSQTAGFGLPARTPQANAVKIITSSARQSAVVDAFPRLEAQV